MNVCVYLGHLLPVGFGVEGGLSEQGGVLLGGHTELVVEGMMPDLPIRSHTEAQPPITSLKETPTSNQITQRDDNNNRSDHTTRHQPPIRSDTTTN